MCISVSGLHMYTTQIHIGLILANTHVGHNAHTWLPYSVSSPLAYTYSLLSCQERICSYVYTTHMSSDADKCPHLHCLVQESPYAWCTHSHICLSSDE